MFVARLICSAPECAEEAVAEAATLEELERMLCDCGCGFEVIAWPDSTGDLAEVVTLHGVRGTDRSLNAAA